MAQIASKTAELSADVLGSVVKAVQNDPAPVVASVTGAVEKSQADVNNCMMGGWTS
ncbi:hypothetical protein [Streptomyces sp. 029-5]|uniref:hypothetical protein n=1 Tax=Streptomyces sp. 029-5 TaxID=2789261 RepID=UPI0039816ED6